MFIVKNIRQKTLKSCCKPSRNNTQYTSPLKHGSNSTQRSLNEPPPPIIYADVAMMILMGGGHKVLGRGGGGALWTIPSEVEQGTGGGGGRIRTVSVKNVMFSSSVYTPMLCIYFWNSF